MGEFDLSLIREFRCRPPLYDRNTQLFRDKFYIAAQWQEISNILGYDVSLLKDRMLQLRNRFNLEKRRLENLREEHPGKIIDSPWPLFSELDFLNDHIRSRRSYKRLMAHSQEKGMHSPLANELNYSGSNLSSTATYMGSSLPNNLVSVKMEEEDEDEEEHISDETDSLATPEENIDESSYAAAFQRAVDQTNAQSTLYQSSAMPMTSMPVPYQSIGVRNMDQMMRLNSTTADEPSSQQQNRSSVTQSEVSSEVEFPTPPHAKKSRSLILTGDKRENKYYAFGNYLSTVLMELPPDKSLKIMDNFTAELTKTLMKKNDREIAADHNGHFNGH